MKKLLFIAFGFLAFNGFSQDCLTADEKSDPTVKANFIEKTDTDKTLSKRKVLFLLEGKEITQAELKEKSPDKIKSIKVIRNKEEIAKYTPEDYVGVVIVKLKKTNTVGQQPIRANVIAEP